MKYPMNHLAHIAACCALILTACGDATLQRGYGETPEELGRAIVAFRTAPNRSPIFMPFVPRTPIADPFRNAHRA